MGDAVGGDTASLTIMRRWTFKRVLCVQITDASQSMNHCSVEPF